jgi:hypothetical protein
MKTWLKKQKNSHKPFKQIINEALRCGLDEVEKPVVQKAYTTHPHMMGLKEGFDLDNIGELLSRIEGENHT